MLGNSAEVGIRVFQTAIETIRILFFFLMFLYWEFMTWNTG